MRYVSISDARKGFANLVDRVERTIVLRNNQPVAAIVGFEDFQALIAAQARERDPERLARLVAAHREVSAGSTEELVDFSEGDVEDLLALIEERQANDGG